MRMQKFLNGTFAMTEWAVLRILLMTQEVVDELSWNFSEGGTSHELDPEISFNENLTTADWGTVSRPTP